MIWFVLPLNLDVNECTAHKPCKNGGTCVNTVGGYNCKCPANYKGKNCDEGKCNWKLLNKTQGVSSRPANVTIARYISATISVLNKCECAEHNMKNGMSES